MEPFHLFRYVDEQSFRFNYRTLTHAERFSIVSDQVFGKGLSWKDSTGKIPADRGGSTSTVRDGLNQKSPQGSDPPASTILKNTHEYSCSDKRSRRIGDGSR